MNSASRTKVVMDCPCFKSMHAKQVSRQMISLMMKSWQVTCASLASVVGGIAAREDVDNVVGVDARTAQEAAACVAPTPFGVQHADALVLTWKVA